MREKDTFTKRIAYEYNQLDTIMEEGVSGNALDEFIALKKIICEKVLEIG